MWYNLTMTKNNTTDYFITKQATLPLFISDFLDICDPVLTRFVFSYRKYVKGNQYGRQEEVYTCEDCSGCPYAKQCNKTEKNRTIRLNEELTSFHKEVIENLESIHGALLRLNRSIQAEGTFGIMKNDRWYKRILFQAIAQKKILLFRRDLFHSPFSLLKHYLVISVN